MDRLMNRLMDRLTKIAGRRRDGRGQTILGKSDNRLPSRAYHLQGGVWKLQTSMDALQGYQIWAPKYIRINVFFLLKFWSIFFVIELKKFFEIQLDIIMET